MRDRVIDYTALDSALLRVIAEKPRSFAVLASLCDKQVPPSALITSDACSVIDRRLQALRKAGKIYPIRTGRVSLWYPVKEA